MQWIDLTLLQFFIFQTGASRQLYGIYLQNRGKDSCGVLKDLRVGVQDLLFAAAGCAVSWQKAETRHLFRISLTMRFYIIPERVHSCVLQTRVTFAKDGSWRDN